MDAFAWVKTAHILSATLLFGTGLGTAFFMWMSYRAGDVGAIAVTARHVVLADLLFTTPAVIIQPLTGAWMIERWQMPWSTPWVAAALALYVLTGLCWLPVVWIQWRAAQLARAAWRNHVPLPAAFHRLMGWWFALGWPAFFATAAIFGLMVFKPALWAAP